MMHLIKHLKTKWNIHSNQDFVLIMLVFSLAGMGVVFLRKGVFQLLGINHAHVEIKLLAWVLLIVPLYQCSALIVSIPFGQFNFFWQRQKALFSIINKILTRSTKKS